MSGLEEVERVGCADGEVTQEESGAGASDGGGVGGVWEDGG